MTDPSFPNPNKTPAGTYVSAKIKLEADSKSTICMQQQAYLEKPDQNGTPV